MPLMLVRCIIMPCLNGIAPGTRTLSDKVSQLGSHFAVPLAVVHIAPPKEWQEFLSDLPFATFHVWKATATLQMCKRALARRCAPKVPFKVSLNRLHIEDAAGTWHKEDERILSIVPSGSAEFHGYTLPLISIHVEYHGAVSYTHLTLPTKRIV